MGPLGLPRAPQGLPRGSQEVPKSAPEVPRRFPWEEATKRPPKIPNALARVSPEASQTALNSKLKVPS